MDHVVYVDAREQELEKLLDGSQTMLIRGAAGRKMPYGRVHEKDVLYFIRNNSEGTVQGRANVKRVLNSEKMDKTASLKMVEDHQSKLQLSAARKKRWGGKRYLVLIEIEQVQPVQPFSIDRSAYGNMDDWLPVADVTSVIAE